MTDFDATVVAPGITKIYENGRDVVYHAAGGEVVSIKAFVDKNYLSEPGGYESQAVSGAILIIMQTSDVHNIHRGERIVDSSDDYTVVSIVAELTDEFETAVAVR